MVNFGSYYYSNKIRFCNFSLGNTNPACKFLIRHWRTFFAFILYTISLNLKYQKRRFLKCMKNCMENLYSLRNYLNSKPISSCRFLRNISISGVLFPCLMCQNLTNTFISVKLSSSRISLTIVESGL